MKKNFKLHYMFINGYEPANQDRDYTCFSVFLPHSDNIKTLCVDEKTLHSILKKYRSDDEISSLWDNIQKRLFDKFENGSYKGYIIVSI